MATTRAGLDEWLQRHGGQASVGTKKVKNPDGLIPEYVDGATYKARDGSTITVVERQVDVPGEDRPITGYDVVDQEDREPSQAAAGQAAAGRSSIVERNPGVTRSDEDARQAAELEREKQWNRENGGLYETHAERRKREQAEEDRATSSARQSAQEERQREADRRAAEASARAEEAARRSEGREGRIAETQARQTDLAERKDARLEAKEEREANRPVPISSSPTQRTITVYNPQTGEYEGRPNPGFDEAGEIRAQQKEAAQAKKEELAAQIQQQQLSRQQAEDEYKRWFDQNVTIPYKQAEEARAKATEIRQAQEAEERRKQFAATYEQRRQETALTAGQNAAKNELELVPNMVGPAFGEQMSSAINSLAKGSSAGINFTSDAFMHDKPDLQGIATRATAKALAAISPYAAAIAGAGAGPGFATADYSGVGQTAGAPPAANGQIPRGVASMPALSAPDPIDAEAPAPAVDWEEILRQQLEEQPYEPPA